MDQPQPRFEFRVWADDFGDIEERIQSLGQGRRDTPSQEVYIVVTDDTQHNLKIRDGCLDVKRLLQTKYGLEQWQPCLKEAFPLPISTLQDKVLPILGAGSPALDIEPYTVKAFLEKIVQPKPNLIAVPVRKHRCQCQVANVFIEMVTVEFDDMTIQSIAIESTHPDAVLQWVKRLALDIYSNLSYPAAIQQFLNLTARSAPSANRLLDSIQRFMESL
jgi:hypothetical protein